MGLPQGKRSMTDEESISVTEFLRRGGVYYAVPGDTKEAAILSCLELIKTAIPQVDRERFFDAIMEREKLCPTSVGQGIAFPAPQAVSGNLPLLILPSRSAFSKNPYLLARWTMRMWIPCSLSFPKARGVF